MKELFTQIKHFKLTKGVFNNNKDFNDMMCYIMKSCTPGERVVLSLISIFELIFFIASFTSWMPASSNVFFYRLSYFILFSASITMLILLRLAKSNFSVWYRRLRIPIILYCIIIIAWAISITYLDSLRTGQINLILYMTIISCIPICMFMHPLPLGIINLSGGAAVFFLIYNTYKTDPLLLQVNLSNYAIFYIVEFVASMFFMYTRIGYYYNMHQKELAAAKIKDVMDAKEAYLINTAHEIRTPISSIMRLNELIASESKNDSIQMYSSGIEDAGNTLFTLIENINDFSKLDAGKVELKAVPFSLRSLIISSYSVIILLAGKKGLRTFIDIDADTPDSLYGDELRIKQVLINLLSNAVKYTNFGAINLKVNYEFFGSNLIELKFSVIDTGKGIKEESLDKLFDSFSKIQEDSLNSFEGTGLGLLLSKKYIELMNGSINVNSVYEKGSDFSFTIPIEVRGNDVVGELSINDLLTKSRENDSNINTFTAPNAFILLVDDDKMSGLVFNGLVKDIKCHITTAQSGTECLSLIKQNHFDIVFLDHLMPGMDGIETLKQLREFNSQTPVIAITSNSGNDAKQIYQNYGFTDYISKPSSSSDVKEILRKYLPQELISLKDGN